jgi:NTE family protein
MRAGVALGGGGPVGTAWYAGLFQGLFRHGFQVGEEDVVVGTSAGAAAGVWLAAGSSSAEFAERVRRSALERGSASLSHDIDLDVVVEVYTALGNAERPLEPTRVLELCSLASNGNEDPGWFIDLWSRQLPEGPWPPALRVAVVDADSGELWLLEADDAVDLPVAVAASAAGPGLRPAVRIGDRRCVDAGVRSSTNADVLSRFGVDRALVINPVPLDAPLVGSGIARSLRSEVEDLRAHDVDVVVMELTPDEVEALGPDPLDLSRVDAAVTAGRRRGDSDGERITEWLRNGSGL